MSELTGEVVRSTDDFFVVHASDEREYLFHAEISNGVIPKIGSKVEFHSDVPAYSEAKSWTYDSETNRWVGLLS